MTEPYVGGNEREEFLMGQIEKRLPYAAREIATIISDLRENLEADAKLVALVRNMAVGCSISRGAHDLWYTGFKQPGNFHGFTDIQEALTDVSGDHGNRYANYDSKGKEK